MKELLAKIFGSLVSPCAADFVLIVQKRDIHTVDIEESTLGAAVGEHT